ncbi:MAG: WhiB family transcriptional regulator [Ilumatobacter sp.]|jgi:hypothetical protein|uniref:WhiB family transcriptional regulator n=1 Tax=Ilumatobacter sp. TaxID=1967498 RepID=UPI00391A65B7
MSSTDELATLIERSKEITWIRDAACGDLGIDQLDLFFVDAGKSLSKEAVAICQGCPARISCLTHAYEHDIAGGYFGGVSPSKRRRLTLAEAVASIGTAVS